jgi:DNA repair protein SbcC/Rad50
MTSIYGSIWRRWDLHVHSPASVLNNEFPGATEDEKWNSYIARLGELEGIAGLGITDYCSIDGYRRVAAARAAGKIRNVAFVFPNLEFRITPVTAEDRAINIHILAAPEIADELEPMLLATLAFEYDGNTYSATRSDLVRLGRAFEQNPSIAEAAAYRSGVNQFKTDIAQIRAALRKNRRLRENCLVVVPNRSGDGNSGIQENSLHATRQEIYRLAHAIFSSNPRDRVYFLGKGVDPPAEVVRKCGGLKPCIHGSDAHNLDRIGEPDDNRYTWIKADASFEGLKQICYEPEFRVQIGATKPFEPFHRIDSVTVDFPTDAELASEEFRDRFCFAGKKTLHFSPGLTCLIGGRGSGKSTLLNLLQESLTGKSIFFRKNTVYSSGSAVDIRRHVSVTQVGSTAAVEFLSQNEIEQFAVDQDGLTQAIYTRLKRLDEDGSLARAEANLNDNVSKLDTLIELLQQERSFTVRQTAVAEEIRTNENLIQSLEDPAYVELTNEAQNVADRLSQVRAARQRLAQVVGRVEQAIAPEDSRGEASSGEDVDERRWRFVAAVRLAIQEARAGQDLSQAQKEEQELGIQVEDLQVRLQQYLSERHISPENIQDLSRASGRLAELRQEAGGLAADFDQLITRQQGISLSEGVLAEYERSLLQRVEPVNQKLQGMGLEVQRITLQYEFDRAAARQALLEELVEILRPMAESGRTPRLDHVSQTFGAIDVLELPPHQELLSQLSTAKAPSKTLQLLLDHFQDEFNYRSFVLRSRRAGLDAQRFRRIRVLYDGKPLKNASFGQRCSAALILLLTLGNTPIVIDEPEAHLDSALIADLLVLLIKMIKSDRQIVFATHNANFVVNGDAELIHILEMDNGRTVVISATLEDVQNRPRILSLEGGERAFQQREERYGLRVAGE